MHKQQRKDKRNKQNSKGKYSNIKTHAILLATIVSIASPIFVASSVIEVQAATKEETVATLENEQENKEKTGVIPTSVNIATSSNAQVKSETEAQETEQEALLQDKETETETAIQKEKEKAKRDAIIAKGPGVKENQVTLTDSTTQNEEEKQQTEKTVEENQVETKKSNKVATSSNAERVKKEIGPGVIDDSEEEQTDETSCQEYVDLLLNENVITEEEAQRIMARGNTPEEPWMNYTEEDVIYLGDAMDAEVCILLSKTNRGKRAFYLTGSALCNRIGNPTWGNKTSVKDVIFSVVGRRRQYGVRTRNLVGLMDCTKHNHNFVYDWARDLLTYGPIASERLVYQGDVRQGRVYEEIGKEYFGEY